MRGACLKRGWESGKKSLWQLSSPPGALPAILPCSNKGPQDHIHKRMSHSGSKAQFEGDTRILIFMCFFWGPMQSCNAVVRNNIRLWKRCKSPTCAHAESPPVWNGRACHCGHFQESALHKGLLFLVERIIVSNLCWREAVREFSSNAGHQSMQGSVNMATSLVTLS